MFFLLRRIFSTSSVELFLSGSPEWVGSSRADTCLVIQCLIKNAMMTFRFRFMSQLTVSKQKAWASYLIAEPAFSPSERDHQLFWWSSGKESPCSTGNTGWALIWEDPNTMEHWSPCTTAFAGACALEPGNHNCWAHMMQLSWSQCALEPMPHKESRHCNEKLRHHS